MGAKINCLVPRPHFSSWPKHFGSCGPSENVSRRSPQIRHRNELTERNWENTVQGLGKGRFRVGQGDRGQPLFWEISYYF